MKEEKVECCFIGFDGKGCGKEAEFVLYYGNSPDDYTFSCASHIGELVDARIESFMVYRLSNQEDCPVCHGVGATTDHHDPCSECGGSGKVGGKEN